MILNTTQLTPTPQQVYSCLKETEVLHRMMKNSTLTKFKRKKSAKSPTKIKKKVHWSEQLEEIHFFKSAESENVASEHDLFFTDIYNSACVNQPTRELQLKTETTADNATFELQHRLEKMSLENKVEDFSTDKRSAWQKRLAAESDFIWEDWV